MNILLISIDCLRSDRCGVYGHHRNTTPTLDSLVKDGFLFEKAFATGPVTTESFPGILAGRLSAQTVTGDNIYQKCLPEGAPTIASHLRDNGWNTAAVISNPRIGEHVGTDHGFEAFRNLRTTNNGIGESSGPSLLPDFAIGEKLYQLRERMRDFESLPYRYEIPFLAFRYYQYLSGWPSVRGETVVDQFLDQLSQLSSPFFGWTHLMDLHGPLHPKAVVEGGLSDGRLFTQFRSHARRVSDIYDSRTEARYDSTLRYIDTQLRRIVDWLESNNLWEETALIVTADHGDALHDRGIYGHPHHYMYDELLSVPLVVRIPGLDGHNLQRPFSLGWLHEVVTEIAELPGMDVPIQCSRQRHLDSENLEPDDDQVILADSISERGHSIVTRRGDVKLIRHTGELSGIHEIEVAEPGFYELAKDPKERAPSTGPGEDLARAAQEVEIDVNDLRKTDESDRGDVAIKDQLHQLGYAE